MAKSMTTLLLAFFFCFVLIHQEIHSGKALAAHHKGRKIDCRSECKRRCSKASRHKLCIRACNACCHRCNCVPPGTAGHADVCPCYAHLTTHGGRKKCP
ncbi:cypmaclein-like [Malania oleifera]|uniref:cypmaclein-like n=1 Tax=Malania oleifera TaxID=397392 RepID=UPI0025ADD569|nr:cypmaclein-like [Malania oleifera]